MANKKQGTVTKEEFLKNRQMYTTEVTLTVRCRVTSDAASDAEAKKWATEFAIGGIEDANIGDNATRPTATAKVVKVRNFTKKELKELLDNARWVDANGNEVYCL